MNKYCRICWNTRNWRQPTGEARNFEMGGSYVLHKGFGHEEWLFNFNWLLKGYGANKSASFRYGFLQPIGKFLEKYEGETFSVLLYTVNPDGRRLIVARIDDLYVPNKDERAWAFKQMSNRGWLKTMRRELKVLGIGTQPLEEPRPEDILNVKFLPSKVFFYDPRPIVTGNHKILRINRYHPLDWDDGFPSTSSTIKILPPDIPEQDEDPTRSEAQRRRSAIDATTYDPRHVELQNKLYRRLCSKYGKTNVQYEKSNVDLSIDMNGDVTYIEVKIDINARRCVRSAIGQLLEYAHYPNMVKANKLLVVGDAKPNDEDMNYFAFIRQRYGLPLYYGFWDSEKDDLGGEF